MKNLVTLKQNLNGMTFTLESNGFYNATTFLKEWNENNPNDKKSLDNFWKQTDLTAFMEEAAKPNYVRNTYLKTEQLYYTKRGKKGGTYMDGLLFCRFLFYISPKLQVVAMQLLLDHICDARNEAGNSYKPLMERVVKITPLVKQQYIIQKVAQALSYIVCNKAYKGIRNDMTSEELKQLNELELKLIMLIDEGFLTDEVSLIKYLQKLWYNKWNKTLIINVA